MAKSDLGKKHLCPNCDKCFYDLKRTPAVCPKCGTEMAPPKRLRTKRGSGSDLHKKRPEGASQHVTNDTKGSEIDDNLDMSDDKASEADDGVGIEDDKPQQVEGGDEQENVIGDTSDIGGVDDGISEVLEHVDEAVAD